MTADKLYTHLLDLGYEGWAFLLNSKVEEDGNIGDVTSKDRDFFLENPKKKFDELDDSFISKIRKAYRDLQEVSYKEKYAYPGGNYKIFIDDTLKKAKKYVDPIKGFDEEDFIKVQIKNCKFSLKNLTVRIEDIDINFDKDFELYELCIEGYSLFLNRGQQITLKRNLKKTIAGLKEELQKRKQKYTQSKILETISYETGNTDIEKLAYLNESGILQLLHKNNSPIKIAKLLMKFIHFKTENAETIAKYIRICLNDPDNLQYPKNTDKVREHLLKIGFKKN